MQIVMKKILYLLLFFLICIPLTVTAEPIELPKSTRPNRITIPETIPIGSTLRDVDEEVAKNGRYGGLVANGNYINFLFFNSNPWPFLESLNLHRFGKTGFHVGDEYELFQPIRPGDMISVRHQLFDFFEKQGKSGSIIFAVHGATFYNQKGKKVAAYRTTIMRR